MIMLYLIFLVGICTNYPNNQAFPSAVTVTYVQKGSVQTIHFTSLFVMKPKTWLDLRSGSAKGRIYGIHFVGSV